MAASQEPGALFSPRLRLRILAGNITGNFLLKIPALMAICGWLVAGAAISSEETQKMNARSEATKPGVFNVLSYGAVGDDKTDNTEAFSACLKAMVDAGGGRMFLPDGIYRGRMVIPGTKQWITLEIAGESEPTPAFGTIGTIPLQNKGTILKCLSESGPSVISAANAPEKLYSVFSGAYVVIRNLEVRTYDNPGIGGIDLQYATQCRLENVVVNTGVYNVQAAKPTHGTCGLITPANGNGAITILRNVLVTGYHSGIQVHEHTDGDNIAVGSNRNGLEFRQAHHASRFSRVCFARNTHHITVSGTHAFSIGQMDTEQPGRAVTETAANDWQRLVSDVNDPRNLGIGDINYWVVIGHVGPVDQFIKHGGASIRARRIGSAPAGVIHTPEQPDNATAPNKPGSPGGK